MDIRVAGDRLLVEKQYTEVGTIEKRKVFNNIVTVLGVGEGLKRKAEKGETDSFEVGDTLLVAGVSEYGEEVYIMPSQVLRWITKDEIIKFPKL